MGWSGGSEIMPVVIEALMKAVPTITLRRRFYMRVIAAFQDEDWDTEGECLGDDPAYDQALKALWKKQGHELGDELE